MIDTTYEKILIEREKELSYQFKYSIGQLYMPYPLAVGLHNNSKLLRHSINCYNIATSINLNSMISSGCLFHNIYGTSSIGSHNFISTRTKDRHYVSSIIGIHVEKLVYIFSRLLNDINISKNNLNPIIINSVYAIYLVNLIDILITNSKSSYINFSKIKEHLPHIYIAKRSLADNSHFNELLALSSMLLSPYSSLFDK